MTEPRDPRERLSLPPAESPVRTLGPGAGGSPPAGEPSPAGPGTPPPAAPGRPGWFKLIAAGVVGALIAAAAATGLVVATDRDDAPTVTAPVPELIQDTAPVEPTELTEMVERVLPSVVNIRVRALGLGAFGETTERQGQGSGVVIDADGLILTNAHVIAGATEVQVVFTDDRDPLAGTVLGSDPDHDVAVVRVDADDLTPVDLGSSGTLRLGDEVVAIGFPLGLGGPTVTKGIVSGLDRDITVGGGPASRNQLSGVIQTDAAINPGNSGGPLLDAAGRLVGITTAGASAAAAENIAFAIPIDEVLPIAERILESPDATLPWLGIQGVTISSSTEAAQAGLPTDTRGVLIAGVIPGGPADGAGVEEGEVLVTVDGEAVDSSTRLTEILARHSPGDRVRLEFVGPSGERTVEVTLGERPPALAPEG